VKVGAFVLCSLAVAAFGGCSLFTSLDGLSDGNGASDSGADALVDGSSDAPADATSLDGGFDTGPIDAGAWAFVASDAVTSSTTPLTVSSSANIRVGDLVVVGCNTSNTGGYITLSGISRASLPFEVVGPNTNGVAYESQISWAVVQAPIGGTLQITANPNAPVSFLDCTINVYRGGGPAVRVVDQIKDIGPVDSGLVSCGPVATVPGGLAYYIAARTSCAGLPLDPAFTQRTGINGNPIGDAVPTDGGTLQTQLDACSNSTGDWICLMFSLSP